MSCADVSTETTCHRKVQGPFSRSTLTGVRTPRDEKSGTRSDYYGLTEIAAALDLDRQLVTAWRRRGSHAIPEPDAELARAALSGPAEATRTAG